MKQGLGGSGETESSVHEHGCAMARIAHFICVGPEGLDGAGLCINDLADGKTCFPPSSENAACQTVAGNSGVPVPV